MAILLPAGSHPEAGESHTFLDWVKDASLQQPPVLARNEAGARVDAVVRLLETRIGEYRQSVLAETGAENAEARIKLNVTASIRRNSPSLTAILGL